MYGDDEGKTVRSLPVGNGNLQLIYSGNVLALGPAERLLIEDLLQRLEKYVAEQKDSLPR